MRVDQGSLNVSELNAAHDIIIRHFQKKFFENEIASLRSGWALLRSSSIVSLNPFLDEKGILRVGGRTGEHPILISSTSTIPESLVDRFHQNAH